MDLTQPIDEKFSKVVLLDTKFHKLTVSELIEYITVAAKQNKKSIINGLNIRSINFAVSLPWYRDFINNSDLVFCDGFGVLLGAKLNGYEVCSCHRMTCPDYIEDLALACEQHNVSLFLLAGKPGVVDCAIDKLSKLAPNLKIQGHHGYFDKSGSENQQVIEQINQFKPDVLYIGFGMPMQEQWILDNISQVDAKVFLPLGACLDFYTGSVPRGPGWMTNLGFEWLSRLVTEPRRLWKRYLIGNFLFFYYLLLDFLRHKIFSNKSKNDS